MIRIEHLPNHKAPENSPVEALPPGLLIIILIIIIIIISKIIRMIIFSVAMIQKPPPNLYHCNNDSKKAHTYGIRKHNNSELIRVCRLFLITISHIFPDGKPTKWIGFLFLVNHSQNGINVSAFQDRKLFLR